VCAFFLTNEFCEAVVAMQELVHTFEIHHQGRDLRSSAACSP
jgi:hypothetical protein